MDSKGGAELTGKVCIIPWGKGVIKGATFLAQNTNLDGSDLGPTRDT